MRVLVLLTTEFPYGSKEPFIENELPIMANNFDKVISFALYANKEERNIPFPHNFSYVNVSSTKHERVFSFIRVLFSTSFWSEFFFVLGSNEAIWQRIKHLIKFSCYVNTPYRKIVSYIKDCNIDSKCNNIFFYSYWFVEHAFLAQRLKTRFNGFLAFSRAHGYDLYETRNRYGYIPFRRYLSNKLDYVFPISENGRELLSRYNGNASIILSRLGTIDHGVAPFTKEQNQITIVSCSWCVPVKRIHLIIEALTMIKDIHVKWFHIGDGVLLRDLKSKSTICLKDNITYVFKGALSNKDLMSFYENNSVDLFINVSSSEGIPVSIMEAFSFGIPALATDVGGVSEIVSNSTNGWLLNVDCGGDDIAELLMRYAAMTDAEIMKLRQGARKCWCEKYNAITNYSEFYSILSGNI